MVIVIAILMAVVLVAILIMVASVYQMDRDFNRRLTELHRMVALAEHKAEYLERKLVSLEKKEAGNERGSDVNPAVAGERGEPDARAIGGTGQADSDD